MALTVANTEVILLARAAPWMALAGMDSTTVDGSNADLADPIMVAARALGVTLTTSNAVVDADLAGISDHDALLDVAELRLLMSIWRNYDKVDTDVGPRSEKLHQISTRIRDAIKQLSDRVDKLHGIGLGEIEAGVIQLDFAQKGDDTVKAF